MTLLLRKIDDLDPWLTLGEAPDLNAIAADPPLWAVRLFIPSPKDKGSLSLYEVEDEDEAKCVAGAWGFTLGEIDKSATKVSFIAADRIKIESAGFKIDASDGGLHHSTDSRHRDISPTNLDQVKILAGLFITGELFNFEGKIVRIAATNEARAERFKFVSIAKLGSGNLAARNILKLVGEEVIAVKGIMP